MKKYTFYVIGLDGIVYYPHKIGGQSILVEDWTPDITKAIFWEDKEHFDCLMNEYVDPLIVYVEKPNGVEK